MARTPDEILAGGIAAQALTNARLQARIEQLEVALAAKTADAERLAKELFDAHSALARANGEAKVGDAG